MHCSGPALLLQLTDDFGKSREKGENEMAKFADWLNAADEKQDGIEIDRPAFLKVRERKYTVEQLKTLKVQKLENRMRNSFNEEMLVAAIDHILSSPKRFSTADQFSLIQTALKRPTDRYTMKDALSKLTGDSPILLMGVLTEIAAEQVNGPTAAHNAAVLTRSVTWLSALLDLHWVAITARKDPVEEQLIMAVLAVTKAAVDQSNALQTLPGLLQQCREIDTDERDVGYAVVDLDI
ncbi:hypothetical protein J8273_2318 [Carpediemonas membranifera]|uniref:Uncharacterized protein n=1 Tax=Carpediemonas membranifera TaxID=201153 RepID=A0A8J6B9G7_9EUKA|nr:hypothetical protein J8273_2318 [Carpediemonas membranifera]|eukprot:KAG9395969.1 hypothetical protein J8273_2318 [Carpediemonas membranifera]